ncbi:MAG: TetR/AcrR family transcriptional regulator [Caldisericia bacterium]|nr:TetR/AcrR family transcriptional regulator [Caldisericia bacterium]
MNKEEILFKCKEYLLENGFENTDIRSLTKLCGISIGTFYNLFKSKENLFCEIFLNDWGKTLKKIEEEIRGKNFDEKVRITLLYFRDFINRYKSSFKIIFEAFMLKGKRVVNIFEKSRLLDFVKRNFGIEDEYLLNLFINLIFFQIRRVEDDEKFIKIIDSIMKEDLWKR